MKCSTIFKTMSALALLAIVSIAQAASLPSPCGAGQIGAGANCMYLLAEGVPNNFDGVRGDRNADTGLDLQIAVWIDFGTLAVQGGGFDIAFDVSGVIAGSVLWNWGTDFGTGEQTLFGGLGLTGYEGIQFDDFAGSGYGGSTGTQPGLALVGTLSLTMSIGGSLRFDLVQPYNDATFPNCFAPGAGSGAPLECVTTKFFSLTVNTPETLVPLPAAVWMMLGGLGALFGFSRKTTV